MADEQAKAKLTLNVDKETIRKAHDMGINMSEITETALKASVIEPDTAAIEDVITRYRELFEMMMPILKKFGINVYIGQLYEYNDEEPMDLYLSSRSTIENWYGQINESTWSFNLTELTVEKLTEKGLNINNFDAPLAILSRLITRIVDTTEKNKEKLKELDLAKRMLDALTPSIKKEGAIHK